MAFTTINKGSSYFNTVLYTGTGSARTITGVGFQPDWVWVKDRTSSNYHYLYDVVRGNNLNLFTNDTSAEVNITTGQNGGGIGSQASDGFTIVAGNVNTNNVNTNTNLYASWNWLANGAGVSNTSGSITSTVSANTTAGFSVVGYTGNGTGGATFGHGLGVTPKMFIIKQRTDANAWVIYHASVDVTGDYTLRFDSGAKTNGNDTNNDTAPTSSLITLGASSLTNQNTSTYIAYCFADVKGYSKFGSYTSNANADGPFVYCGFKPAFVLLKNSQSGGTGWWMWTGKIPEYNVINKRLNAESASSESTANMVDFTSNGFKIRSTGDSNYLSDKNIFMAFAENPFVLTDGTPVTAR